MGKQQSGAPTKKGLVGFENDRDKYLVNDDQQITLGPKKGLIFPGGRSVIPDTNPLSGEYDFGVLPGRPMDEMRAQQQSGFDQTGNAIARLLSSTVLKTAQTAGFLAGLAGVGNSEVGGSIARAADNGFAQWAEDLENDIKEKHFPVYKSMSYQNASTFQNLFESEFWADDVVDGLAFMLQAQATGIASTMVTRGLGVTSSLAKIMSSANKVGKFGKAGERGVTQAAKIARNLDLGTRAAFMTASESMFEAKGVRDEVRRIYKGQINPNTGVEYTKNEIDKIAGIRAADTYALNMIALAPSNLIEASFLFKKLPASAGLNDIALEQGAKVAARQYKGFKRASRSYPARIGKGIVKGGATEGFYEENIQYSIQSINQSLEAASRDAQLWPQRLGGKMDESLAGMSDLDDPQRGKSILLGSIIGAPMAVRSEVLEKYGREKGLQNQIDAINKAQSELGSFYKSNPEATVTIEDRGDGKYFKTTTLKDPSGKQNPVETPISKEEYDQTIIDKELNPEEKKQVYTEPGSPILDNQGKPVLNEEVIQKFIQKTLIDKNLQDLIDLETTVEGKDNLTVNLLQQTKLALWAFTHFNAGVGDLAVQKLRQYKGATPEEIAAMGFDPSTAEEDLPGLIDKRIKQVKNLQLMYDNVSLGLIQDGVGKSKEKAFEDRKWTLFHLGASIFALDDVLYKTQQEKAKYAANINDDPLLQMVDDAVSDYIGVENNMIGAVISNTSRRELNKIQRELNTKLEAITAARKAYNDSLENTDKKGKPLSETDPGAYTSKLEALNVGLVANRQLAVKVAEMTDARVRLKEDFNALLDPVTGDESFAKFLAESKVTRNSHTIRLTNETSISAYEAYEKGRIRSMQLEEKQASILNNFLDFRISESLADEESLPETILFLMETGGTLRPNVMNKLKTAIRERLDTLVEYRSNDRLSQYIDIKNTKGADPNMFFSAEEIAAFEKIYLDALQDVETGELEFLSDFLDNKALLNEITNTFKPLSTDELRRKVADEYLKLATRLQNQFSKGTYNNTPEAERILNDLQNLQRIFKGRVALVQSDPFKGFRKRNSEAIANVQEIVNKLKEREAADEIRKEGVMRDAATLDYTSLGIIQEEGVESRLKPVQDLLRNNPKAAAVFDKIDKEGFKPVYAKILQQMLIDGAVEDSDFANELLELSNIVIDDVLDKMESEGLLGSSEKQIALWRPFYFNNPVAAFEGLPFRMHGSFNIPIGSEPGFVPIDKRDGSPLKEYLKTQNPVELLRNVQKEKNRNQYREFVELTKLHIEAVAAYKLRDLATTSYNVASDYRSELDSVEQNSIINEKTGKGFHLPSNEQIIAQRELKRFFHSHNISKNSIDELDDTLDRFKYFAFLKSLAGTGKTNVVSRWIRKNLGLIDSEFIVGAMYEPAALEIQNSLKENDPTEALTIDEIIDILVNKPGKSDELKLIILDEAGAIDATRLEELANAVKKINDARIKNAKEAEENVSLLKVIVLGDPNQLVSAEGVTKYKSRTPKVPIEDFETNKKLSDVIHTTRITPMTRTYRTPVEPIVDFQNMFINNATDMSKTLLETTANTENPEQETTLDLFGVVSTTDMSKDLRSILDNKAGDGRDRVLITSITNLEPYKAEFRKDIEDGNLRILPIGEVAGITAEEIYIDIPPGENVNNATHNSELYTATSRAKYFIMAAGLSIKSNPDSGIEKQAEDNAAIAQDINEEYKGRLEEELKEIAELYDASVLEGITPKEAEKKDDLEDEPVENNEPAVEEDADTDNAFSDIGDEQEPSQDVEDVLDYDPGFETPVSADLGPATHNVIHSKNETTRYVSSTDGEQIEVPALEVGGDVYYVATSYRKNEQDKPGVMLLNKVTIDGQEVWREVGVMSADEVLPADLQDWHEKVSKNQLSNTANAIELLPAPGLPGFLTAAKDIETIYEAEKGLPLENRSVVAKGKVSQSSPLRFNYAEKGVPGRLYNRKSIKGNRMALKRDLAAQFVNDMWNNKAWSDIEKRELIDSVAESGVLTIFTKRQIATGKHGTRNFVPKVGIPYFVIKGFRLPNSRKSSATPFYIQLAPRRLNMKSVIYGTTGNSIQSLFLDQKKGLIPAIKELEALYKGIGLKNAVLGTDLFNQLTYKIGLKKDLKQFLLQAGVPIKEKDLTDKIKKVATKITSLLYLTETTKDNKGNDVISHPDGPAQVLFNNLAKTNLDSGEILLRVHRRDKNGNPYSTGKHIMVQDPTKGSSYSNVANEYLDRAERRFRDQTNPTDKEVETFRKNLRVRLGKGYSVKDLDEIFVHDENFDSSVKGGFGLRTPLHRESMESGKTNSAKNIENRFTGISKTQVHVDIDLGEETRNDSQNTDDNKETKRAAKESVKNKQRNRRRNMRLKEEVPGEYLGQDLRYGDAFLLAKNLIPELTHDTFRLISAAEMESLVGNSWGLFKDGIIYLRANPDGTVKHQVVRHEVFHRVFWMGLTRTQQLDILGKASDRYNISIENEKSLEEHLADEFMTFDNSTVEEQKTYPQWLQDFFDWFRNSLKFLYRNLGSIEQYFALIEQGRITTPDTKRVEMTRNKIDLNNYGNDARVFRGSENYMRQMTADIIGGIDLEIPQANRFKVVEEEDGVFYNLPVTFEEGLVSIYSQVMDDKDVVIPEDIDNLTTLIKTKKGNAKIDFYGQKLTRDQALELLDLLQYKLKVVSALSNKNTYNEIIKHLFTDKFVKGGIIVDKEDVSDMETSEEIDNSEIAYEAAQDGTSEESDGNPLADHINTPDQSDPNKKITQKVRNYFSSIPFENKINNNRREFLDPKYVAVSLMKVLDGVDWASNDLKSASSSLQEAINLSFRGYKQKALGARLTLLTNTALAQPVVPEIRFESSIHGVPLFIYSTKATDISNYTFSEMFNQWEELGIAVIQPNQGSTLEAYFEDIISRRIPGVGTSLNAMTNLAAAWRKYESSQILAETVATYGSHSKKNTIRILHSYEGRSQESRDTYTTFQIGNRGQQENSTSVIKEAIISRHDSLGNKWLSAGLKERIRRSRISDSEKVATIKDFYREIGVLHQDEQLSILANYQKTYDSLQGFLASATEQLGKQHTFTDKTQDTGKIERAITMNDLVMSKDFNTGRMRDIGRLLSLNSLKERPSSYLSADGKIVYDYVINSYASRILNNLTNNKATEEYLNTDFFKLNPFVKYRANLKTLFFYDGLNQKEHGHSTVYKKESKEQFMERVFSGGFLGMIANKGGGSETSYAQFFYTPGQKSNPYAVEVPVFNVSQGNLEGVIDNALAQEMRRVNPGTDPDFTVDNYTKNWNKSYIKGVKGVPANVNERKKAVKASLAALEEAAETALLNFVARNQPKKLTAISPNQVRDTFNKIKEHLPAKTKLTSAPDEKLSRNSDKFLEQWTDFLRPIFRAFYMNNYFNGHFANQLILGDQAFYKNSEQVIKRLDIVWAPGYTGVANDNHKATFAPAEFKMGVLKDISYVLDQKTWGKLERIVNTNIGEYTDSQGYFLPERRQELHRLYGSGMQNRSVLKPVHYSIDNKGIPRAIKYSTIELTDKIVKLIPELNILRNSMRMADAGEVVFKSGFKVGNRAAADTQMKKSITVDELKNYPAAAMLGMKVGDQYFDFPEGSVVGLPNSHHRIQLNPTHSIDSSTKNPSQLTHMINLRGTNAANQKEMYRLMAEHMRNARLKLIGALSVKQGKHFGKKSEDSLRKMLAAGMMKIDSLASQANSILAQNPDGSYALSINAPFIAKKILQQFSSTVTKNVVAIKYKGSNFVLQSAYGAEDLAFDPKTGVAEVYMPDIYAKKFTKGEILNEKNGKLLGFRLPSSDIHSAIVIKIKDFYDPVEMGQADNIIIAPKEIVFFHGSDYDVDKLFTIREQLQQDLDPYDNRDVSFPDFIVNEKGKKIIDLKGNKKKNIILGRDSKGKPLTVGKNKQPLDNFVKEEMSRVRHILKNVQLSEQEFEDTRIYLNALEELYPILLRNTMVSIFIDSMTKEDVRDYLFSPTNIDRYKSDDNPEAINKWFASLKMDDFTQERDLNDITDHQEIRSDINVSEAAIGTIANFNKGLEYMFSATTAMDNVTDNAPAPEILESKSVTIDGGVYKDFSLYERTWNAKDNTWKRTEITLPNGHKIEPQIWETLDSTLQIALDNLNEQVMGPINMTQVTIKAYLSGIGMGIPLKTMVALMKQPIMNESIFATNKGFRIAKKSLAEELKVDTTGENKVLLDEVAPLKFDKLQRLMTKPLDKLSNKDKLLQLNVLETFGKLDAIGSQISEIAQFSNILKQMPPNFYDIQKQMGVIDKIYTTKSISRNVGGIDVEFETVLDLNAGVRDSFLFPNVNILTSLPHLKEAYETLKMIKSVDEHLIKVNDPRLQKLAESIRSKYLDVSNWKESFQSGATTTDPQMEEAIRYEFMKYLMTGLEYKQDKINVNLNTINEAPYEFKFGGRDAGTKKVGGAEAWAQRFVNRVRDMQHKERAKPPHKQNTFILDLVIDAHPDYPSLNRILFPPASQADPSLQMQYMQEFERINPSATTTSYNQDQFDFLKYLILTQGLEWRASSYITVLPAGVFSGFTKALESKLDDVLGAGSLEFSKEIEQYYDHFAIQFLNNFEDAIPTIPSNLRIGFNEAYNVDKDSGAYWDIKYKFNEGFATFKGKKGKYPVIIKDNYNNLLYKVYEPEKDNISEGSYVLYQRIAKKGLHAFYQGNEDIASGNYTIAKTVDPAVRTVDVEDNTVNTLPIKKSGFLKKGDVLFLKNYSDFARVGMRKVEVTGVGNNIAKLLEIKSKVDVSKKAAHQFSSTSPETNEKALRFILDKLQSRIGLKYRMINDTKKDWAGVFEDGVIWINTAHAKLDTPFHEYLHPFVHLLKDQNPILYNNLLTEMGTDAYGQEVLRRTRSNPKYQEQEQRTEVDVSEEALVTLLAELAANRLGKNTGGVLFKLLKDFAKFVTGLVKRLTGNAQIDVLRPSEMLTTATLQDIADAFALGDFQIQGFEEAEFEGGRIARTPSIPQVVDGKVVFPNKTNLYGSIYSLSDTAPPGDGTVTPQHVIDDLKFNFESDMGLKLATGREVYEDNAGNQYRRLTEWIKENLSKSLNTDEIATSRATQAFKREKLDASDPTATITVEGIGEMTFAEYKDFAVSKYEKAASEGTYAHLKIEKFLTKDPVKKAQLDVKMQDIEMTEGVNPNFLRWLDNQVMEYALDRLGIRVAHLDSEVDAVTEDRIETEMPVASKVIGVATTIDALVEHMDGSLSIIDWKSGSSFFNDRNFVTGLLEYGDQYTDIEDSRLDRAKLEVVLRAMMIKEQKPEARFRKLRIAYLSKHNLIDVFDIDVPSYVNLIRDYLREKDKEAYNIWNDAGVFDANAYGAFTELDAELTEKEFTNVEDKITYLSDKLAMLQRANPDISNPEIDDKENSINKALVRKRAKAYVDQLVGLKTQPGNIAASSDDLDVTWIQNWFGNVYTVKNKFIQAFSQIVLSRKDKISRELFDIKTEMDEKILAVKKEYDASGTLQTTINKATAGWLGGYNYRDFFKFLWVYKDNKIDKEGFYWREHTDPSLSPAQAEFIKFMREKMDSVWEEAMLKDSHKNEEGTTMNVLTAMGYGSNAFVTEEGKLESDFAPRVFMGSKELKDRYSADEMQGQYKGKGWANYPKAVLDQFFSKRRSQFLSDYVFVSKQKGFKGIKNAGQGFIPIKTVGTPEMVAAEDHTFDAQAAFFQFMDNMVTKKHMDNMIGVAEGIKVHLQMIADYKDKFKNSINFIENQILINILNARRRNNMFSKTIKVKLYGETYVVDPEQILSGMKQLATWSSMWLKPVQGFANGILITVLNNKDAVKGSIANLVGVPPEHIDFTMGDLARAEAVYMDMVKDGLISNLDNNKLYNIANKLRFLTDNYDYKVAREDVLVSKAKLWRETNLYVFHQIGEDFGNYSLLAAQLMHQTNPETGKSIWDSYDSKGNWIAGKRFTKLNPDGTKEDVTDLTSEEVTKLKRVTQRIHGSYRQEERSAIELYALGRWVMQFKKYMPQLMLNLYTGKYKDQSLGAWETVKEGNTVKKYDGETVYKWTERTTHGKVRVMFNLFSTLAKLRTDGWSNLDDESKQSVIDVAITTLVMVSWLIGSGAVPDDWKKDPKFKRLARIFAEDIAQGAMPSDILRNMTNPVPVLTKLFNFMQAFEDWLVDGVIYGETTQRGTTPGVEQMKKQIPIFASQKELQKYFGKTEFVQESDGIFSMFQDDARKR